MDRVVNKRPRTKVSTPRVSRTVRLPNTLDSRLYCAAQRRQWTVHETIIAAIIHWLNQEDPSVGREKPA